VSPLVRVGDGEREDGAGTVLALGLVALVVALVLAVAGVGEAVVARHRAAGAADLAALAGADRSSGRAPGLPCPAAAETARRNGASLVSCVVASDGSVTVRASCRLPRPWRRMGVASAVARAGHPP
jgi:secretion/DNA translocation related TadE-like protein